MFALVLVVVAVLMSFLCSYALTRLSWRSSDQTKLPRQSIPIVIGFAMLMALVSCSDASSPSLLYGSTSRGNDPPRDPPHAAAPSHAGLKSADWSSYHNDNVHTGYAADEPDPHHLTLSWSTGLSNAVYAEPLTIGNRVIVATEGDTISSLDARTGRVQWSTKIGDPVPLSTIGCSGTIDLLGITGTPVYDPVSGLVFAVAEVTGPRHLLVGVDVNTGKIAIKRSVDVPAMNPPQIYLQRPALALSHGLIYMAFGGLADDCGQYHGTIVASQTDGQGPLLSYQVPTHDSGGIWGSSGPVIDQDGRVYVSVGNEDHMTQYWDWDLSNAVLRLSPTLQLEDSFAPANWRAQDTGNQDLGSMGPALVQGGYVFAAGKSGDGYLLHADALGGIGGEAATAKICDGLALGGSATVGSQIFVPCSDGSAPRPGQAGAKAGG